jgi:hypothetical protein
MRWCLKLLKFSDEQYGQNVVIGKQWKSTFLAFFRFSFCMLTLYKTFLQFRICQVLFNLGTLF